MSTTSQSLLSVPRTELDLSSWLTKQQAAEAIGVSTKTIEKLADDRLLQQQTYRRPGKPAIAVYHPDDVQRERLRRNPDAEPFVLPQASQQQHLNRQIPDWLTASQVSQQVTPQQPLTASQNSEKAIDQVDAAAWRELALQLVAAPLELQPWLGLEQASRYSGLPVRYLRARAEAGWDCAINVGSGAPGAKKFWRFNREGLGKVATP